MGCHQKPLSCVRPIALKPVLALSAGFSLSNDQGSARPTPSGGSGAPGREGRRAILMLPLYPASTPP